MRTASSSSTSRIVDASVIGVSLDRSPAGRLLTPASYYSPVMAASQPHGYGDSPAAPRRGSLARPINGRLYRAVVRRRAARARRARASRSPGPCRSRSRPPGLVRHRARRSRSRTTSRRSTRTGGPGAPARSAPWSWFGDQLPPQSTGSRRGRRSWDERIPGLGRVRAPKRRRRSRRASRQDVIVVMAHRDDIGTRARRERQRERDGRPDRARPRLRPAARRGRGARRPLRARSCSSRPTAAPTAGSAPRISSSDSPYRGPDRRRRRSRRDRGARSPEHRDRGRLAALAERGARRDGDRADRRADRRGAAPRERARPARRPRLPVHALRAGPVRRRRPPGVTITTGGDRPPPAFGDRGVGAGLDAARAARRGRPAARRLARPEPLARAEPGELRLGRRAGSSGAGRSSSSSSRCSSRSSSRSSISTRSAAARQSQLRPALRVASHPASLLVVRRHRFHVFSPARRLAVGRAAPTEPRNRRSPATGPRWALVGLARGRRDRLGALAAAPAPCGGR